MKKKVLIVTPLYPPYTGGAAIYFYRLAQNLKDKLNVIVLTTRHSKAVASNDIKLFRTIPNFLETYVPDNIVYKMLRYLFLPAATFLSSFIIYLRHRPKLIHVHSSTSITLGACLFSLLFRIPIVIDAQDLFPRNFPLKWVIKIGHTPRYIALGKKVEEMLLSINIPKKKILTLQPAHPSFEKKITEKPKKGRDKKKVIILFIGGLTRIKGVDVLLESFKIASRHSDNLLLKIVGDGPMRSYCERVIDKYNLNVELLGTLPYESTLKEIYSCDFLVLASRTEGYPRVILEAFEFKKPVIATNVGGVSELVRHNENGILVDPDNSEALAEAMLKLGKDRALRDIMGENGKNSLKNLPTWAALSEKISLFYGL
jgi:glycosyltransferase involved in cell wall biosynthesis